MVTNSLKVSLDWKRKFKKKKKKYEGESAILKKKEKEEKIGREI